MLLTLLLTACKPPAGGIEGSVNTSPAWSIVARHDGDPVVVAHRGASAYRPENTLASYKEAIRLGAKVAETDVHMSSDGHVVIIHDPTTDRTTGVAHVVSDTTWAELRTLDAGSWFAPEFKGEPLPELGELLDLTHHKIVQIIEIKAGAGVVDAVRTTIDARGMRPEVIIFSFDASAVAEARRQMPDVPGVYLLEAASGDKYTPDDVARVAATGANAAGFSAARLNPETVKAAHDAGYPVFVWTVNEPTKALEARDLGADLIITNAPDLIESTLRPKGV